MISIVFEWAIKVPSTSRALTHFLPFLAQLAAFPSSTMFQLEGVTYIHLVQYQIYIIIAKKSGSFRLTTSLTS